MTDKIEQISIEKLIPYARNARTHSDAQVAQIAASIREFGFNNPVLIKADNTIIAGHGRVLAARKLGLSAVPCLCLDHLTDQQARAYVLADNKLAMNAEWDNDLLNLELEQLIEAGFDVSLAGFDEKEIAGIVPNFEPGTEDDQGKLDQLEPKWVSCPHCGKEFDLREHGQG